MPVLHKRITCVAVGEGGVGKRILLCSWAERVYGHVDYCSKHHYKKEIVLEDRMCEVDLYNVPASSVVTPSPSLTHIEEPLQEQEATESVPKISNAETANVFDIATCIFLCFSVINRHSFKLIKKKWLPFCRAQAPLCPIVLVGLKADARKTNKEGLTKMVTDEEAEAFASSKKLHYFEVSAKTQSGVKTLFKQAIDLSIERIRAREKMEEAYEKLAVQHAAEKQQQLLQQQQQQQQILQQIQLQLQQQGIPINSTTAAALLAGLQPLTPGRPAVDSSSTGPKRPRKAHSLLHRILQRLRICKSACCLGRDKECTGSAAAIDVTPHGKGKESQAIRPPTVLSTGVVIPQLNLSLTSSLASPIMISYGTTNTPITTPISVKAEV